MDDLQRALHSLLSPVRRGFRRPLRIAEPFIGMGGYRELMRVGQMPYVACNVYDKDGRLQKFYASLRRQDASATGNITRYKLGKNGDMLEVDITALEWVDGLISGPPCRPWAPGGARGGTASAESLPFQMLLEWIIYLAHSGSLLFFAVENSVNVESCIGEQLESFADTARAQLQREVPYFVTDIVQSELLDLWPQKRLRSWLRGMRVDAANFRTQIPRPLRHILPRRVGLEELLDLERPNVLPSSMTETHLANLAKYEERIQKDRASELQHVGDLAVFDINRKHGMVFSTVLRYDAVPPLQLKNVLFVMSVGDVDAARESRRIFRYLSLSERFRLQGHPGSHADLCSSSSLGMSITGNAFAVPMCASIVIPMLHLLSQSGVVEETGMKPVPVSDLFKMTSKALKLKRHASDVASSSFSASTGVSSRVLKQSRTV